MTHSNKLKHIAIVMDGNGRWAKKRHLPRTAGHRAGVKSVREVVKWSVANKLEVLTLFAFSSENWQRPQKEVASLMSIFVKALEKEALKLHKQNIKLRFIGDRERFDLKLQKMMQESQALTAQNTGLTLLIAANYGGQWDLTQALQTIIEKRDKGEVLEINSALINQHLATADLPPPDLFIRPGGVLRISNFLLWQIAYSELYFTDTLWPDFNASEMDKAVSHFQSVERRYGLTSEQVKELC